MPPTIDGRAKLADWDCRPRGGVALRTRSRSPAAQHRAGGRLPAGESPFELDRDLRRRSIALAAGSPRGSCPSNSIEISGGAASRWRPAPRGGVALRTRSRSPAAQHRAGGRLPAGELPFELDRDLRRRSIALAAGSPRGSRPSNSIEISGGAASRWRPAPRGGVALRTRSRSPAAQHRAGGRLPAGESPAQNKLCASRDNGSMSP